MAIIASRQMPNLRGAAQWLKDAMDQALSFHRREHLPRHFTREALTRYPSEYAPVGKAEAAKIMANRVPLRDILAKMTPAQRQAWQQMQGKARRGAYARAKAILRAGARAAGDNPADLTSGEAERRYKLPLVKTGHLREMALQGTGTFTGPLTARRLSIPVPYYFNFWKPGQMRKAAALGAITADEAEAVTAELDRHVQAVLNHTTIETARAA